MVSEAARMVMILPMDIIGYRTADRNLLRAGNDWQKPACGNDQAQNLLEENSSLACDYAAFTVEADKPIQSTHFQKRLAIVEAAIAVAPAVSEWQKGMIWM